MRFVLRLMFYLLLSVPFGLLTWYFGDIVQRIASSLWFQGMPDPGRLTHTAVSFSVFLPWIVGLTAVAVFEAHRSRSLFLTGFATVTFWMSSVIVLTTFSVIGLFGVSGTGAAVHRIGLIGPQHVPHLFIRHLHDLFGPLMVTGTHTPTIPGMWHLQGLFGMMFIMGVILVVALGIGYAIGNRRQRHV